MAKANNTEDFKAYAKSFNTTIESAIHDRDWPLNREECIAEFKAATGKNPTEEQIKTMAPDSQKCINEFTTELYQSFNF